MSTTSWRERYLRSRYMVQKIIREYSEKPALKAYIEIFLTLTAISLFGVFAIRPTTITIGKLVKEIDAKEKTLAVMKDKIENLETAKELFTKENEKINFVNEAIPSNPEPDIFSLQLEELAKKNNVTINGFTIGDTMILGEAETETNQDITVLTNISGDYFNLINFSNDIENLRRPVKYDGLSIVAIGSGESSSLLMTFSNMSTPFSKKIP